jgi:hypothetical protein
MNESEKDAVMSCPGCNRDIPGDSGYCPRCGTRISDAALDLCRYTPEAKGQSIENSDEVSQAVTISEVFNIEGVKEVVGVVAHVPKAKRKERIPRRERRDKKWELKQGLKENKREQKSLKEQKRKYNNRYQSIQKRSKVQDKEASSKAKSQRNSRNRARNIQDYIGYEKMFKDGLCEVEYDSKRGYGIYSETLAFDDISYQSAREEAQTGIFSIMSQFYNYFGSNALLQMSVVKTKLPDSEIGRRRFFDPESQDTEDKRVFAEVYNSILNDKMREGVSNIYTDRYVTYMVGAESADKALVELAHIRNGVMQSFTKVGSKARKLDGTERLEVIYDLLNPGKTFDFDYGRDLSVYSPETTKDFIAPLSIDFKPDGNASCYFQIDGQYAQVLSIKGFGSELSDDVFSEIINLPIPLNLTWYAQGMDMSDALLLTKKQIAFIDNDVMKVQQQAINKGYSWEAAVPAALRYSKAEAMEVLDNLQTKNQRMFMYTGLIYTTAPSLEELMANVNSIIRVSARNSVEISELHYLQKEGLNSILPLGHNHIEVSRSILTAELAVMMPFAAVDLLDRGGNYYGQNKESNNLIFADRRKLSSPIGFIAGQTGSGKSFMAKGETENTVLNRPGEQIIILDRAGEYVDLVKANGGSVVSLSVVSDTHMNPFDFDISGHKTRIEEVTFKTDAIIAQASANAAENGETLSDAERSIIIRCVGMCYERAGAKGPDVMPTLGDFYEILKEQPESLANNIALRYEQYVYGVMSFFNNQTNIDFSNKFICINLKELPEAMLVFALINVCEFVRNRMYYNDSLGVRTHLYVEEIQSMFQHEPVINYFARFSRECRKFGMFFTGLTQNASAMLEHKSARDIVSNAGFIILLKQSPTDRALWSELLGLSPVEEQYIDETVSAGDGLLIYGAKKVPFRGAFPKGNVLYDIFNTDPNDAGES